MVPRMELPREGNKELLLNVFGNLGQKYNSRLASDPKYLKIDGILFNDCNWREFYGDMEEAIPLNSPMARGKEVDLNFFFNSDHVKTKENLYASTTVLA